MKVTLIPGFNPGPYTGAGNNTWLLAGREPALIDAATGEPRHLDALAEALDGRSLARVLVTHGHPDHASGAPGLASRWAGVAFFKMPWPERDGEYAVDWRPLADGELAPAGGRGLRVLHTPGHAPDHLCFFDEEDGTLFCGDLLIQGGTVVVPASLRGQPDAVPRLARAHPRAAAGPRPAGARTRDRRRGRAHRPVRRPPAPPRRRDPVRVAPGAHDAGGHRGRGLSGSRRGAAEGGWRKRARAPAVKLEGEGAVRRHDAAWELAI